MQIDVAVAGLPPFWFVRCSALSPNSIRPPLSRSSRRRRKRKRLANGKCEGRKSIAETRPEAVALAKSLARRKPKGGKLSLRDVAAAMAAQGVLNERGRPFNPKSVAVMVAARAR